MLLGCVPLDSRPVNTDNAALCAELAGVELLLPPPEVMDSFLTPAPVGELTRWMLDQDRVHGWVAALDMLAYGGLIASRRGTMGIDQALANLGAAAELKRRRPGTPVYAYSIIMRLSITVHDRAGSEVWSRIFEALSRGREPVMTDAAGREAWEDYQRARARNRAVNLAAVEMAGAGVLDRLVLGQEDAAPVGPHVAEQAALVRKIAGLGLESRVALTTGADELGAMLLARMALDLGGGPRPSVAVFYDNPAAPGFGSLYEDVTLEANIGSKLHILGCPGAPGPADGDLQLLVHRSSPGQSDLFLQQLEGGPPRPPGVSESGFGALKEVTVDRPLLIADVEYANGGDLGWFGSFSPPGGLGRCPVLAAAWNTTGNTLGSVLAAGCCWWTGGAADGDAAWRRLLLVRCLDDWIYQGMLRGELIARLRGAAPDANPWNLGGDLPLAQGFLDKNAGEMLYRELPWLTGVCKFSRESIDSAVRLSLPWPRVFEVRVELMEELLQVGEQGQ